MPKKPDKRALRYAQLCVYRMQEREEDRIAQELGFGTPKALYLQLANDGFPVCIVCGETPAQPGHCENPGERRRKSPPFEEKNAVKLPPAGAAWYLFRRSLENLRLYIGLVSAEEEWLYDGKRFVTAIVDRDAYDIVERGGHSDAEWRELCEQHGADPKADNFKEPVFEVSPEGVNRFPSRRLNALVAAYALTGGSLKPLLKALHHTPDTAAEEKLRRKVRELETAAGHLAAVVRGAILKSGRGIEELSPRDQLFAWHVGDLERGDDLSDEELCEYLASRFRSLAEGLTSDDVRRIRKSGLKPPE